MTSVRELCTQIELNKESLTRQLVSLTISHDQLKEQVSDLQTEGDVLKQQVTPADSHCIIMCTQVADGRGKAENLEKLLAHERRKASYFIIYYRCLVITMLGVSESSG